MLRVQSLSLRRLLQHHRGICAHRKISNESNKQTTSIETSNSSPSSQNEPAHVRVARGIREVYQHDSEVKNVRRKAMAELRGPIQTKTLPQILAESEKNYSRRYVRPSSIYHSTVKSKLIEEGVIKPKNTEPGWKLIKRLGTSQHLVSTQQFFEPLNVGDAVELSTSLNRSVLSVIVELPSAHDDPRYTVMDRLGELSYVEKSAFKLRLPGVIPSSWLTKAVHKVPQNDAEYGSIKTTNFGFETYAVNPFLRKHVAKPLIDLTNAAWRKLPDTTRKLEIIHRVLQTLGPRQVSLSVLTKAVESFSLEEFERLVKNKMHIDDVYDEISKILSQKVGVDFSTGTVRSVLGKDFGVVDVSEKLEAASLYSVVLGLRKQTRLWSTQYSSRSTFLPLSITVLPMDYVTSITSVVEKLKADPSLFKKFGALVENGAASDCPNDMKDIVFLLKEYAVGNLDDAVTETLVCQLMKTTHAQTITKSTVWDLVAKFDPQFTQGVNPTHYSKSLCLPGKQVSQKADLEQLYFDTVDVTNEREGDIAKHRTDYTDMNVYCIDSETAHEIDDGVSIKEIDASTYRVYIHIADPVSYMNPDSTLTKIAYERAFTTYQPEMISAMLPKSMSDLAGLGVDGKKTRALTFSVPVNKKTGEANFDDARVEATYLSKFPKFTYKNVNAALEKVEVEGAVKSKEHTELLQMKELSEKLRAQRIQAGAVVFPDQNLNVQVRISKGSSAAAEADAVLDDGSEMTIDQQLSSPSVVLVTELMILANRVAARVLKDAQRPGVFKSMRQLPLWGTARNIVSRLNQLCKADSEFAIADLVKALKFISPAIYSSQPSSHLMLGVQEYAPSTSPLRRFGDIVNHFQLHTFLNDQPEVFNGDQVQAMVLHIEARNDILKKASRNAGAYYTMNALKQQLITGVPLTTTNFVVMSKPQNGSVNGVLLGYGVFGTMKLAAGRRPPRVGDSVKDFTIEEIDPVGGKLMIKQN